MTRGRRFAAVLLGAFLATLPFWKFLPIPGVPAAHSDHAPRHAGQLAMVGDHHIELRRADDRLDVYVSDPWRREIEPRTGCVQFDQGEPISLQWSDGRLTTLDHPGARRISVRVVLSDGTELAVTFDFTL